MSGRLVILRHKKWNVWNQDNQERVLKDERLHKEKEEKRDKEQKKLLQEQQRQSLLNQTNNNINQSSSIDFESSSSSTSTSVIASHEALPLKPLESINFFKEIEENEQRNILNKLKRMTLTLSLAILTF